MDDQFIKVIGDASASETQCDTTWIPPIDTLPSDTFNISGCWKINAHDGDSSLNGELSMSMYGGYLNGQFRTQGGENYPVSASFVNGAWELGINTIRYIYDEQVPTDPMKDGASFNMPIRPPDPPMGPSYHFRIDSFQRGTYVKPSAYFTGKVMDATFTATRGDLMGFESPCDTVTVIYNDTTRYYPVDHQMK
jgi:hypothetical protein